MSVSQVVCRQEVRGSRVLFFWSHHGLARSVHMHEASVYYKVWPAGSLTSNFAEWFALPLAILLAKNVFGASKTPVSCALCAFFGN